MKENTIDKLIDVLRHQNSELELECLNRLTMSNGTINVGSVMERTHVIDVYRNRMNIANDVTGSGILGLERILNRLVTIENEQVRVLTITSSDIYTLFTNEDLTALYGVIKTPSFKRSDNYIDRDAIYFSNGRVN